MNDINKYIQCKDWDNAYDLTLQLYSNTSSSDDSYYSIKETLAELAYHVREYKQSKKLYRDILDNKPMSLYEYREMLIKHSRPVKAVMAEYLNTPLHPVFNKRGKIMISMTTCKRYDLFTRTVNSFINCCHDINDYVLQWFVVDDNSSETDRMNMVSRYPFIQYNFKSQHDKGHAISLNIIRERAILLGVDYILHIEDDFQFTDDDNYIAQLLSILDESNSYGQALFNRNSAETLDDTMTGFKLGGGQIQYTKNGLRYLVHRHCKSIDPEYQDIIRETEGMYNCAYWPHFSLRPGLTRVSALVDVGPFNEAKGVNCEYEYALRYNNMGYKTTFLDRIVCQHIGKLTIEKSDTKPNAYALNGEQQHF